MTRNFSIFSVPTALLMLGLTGLSGEARADYHPSRPEGTVTALELTAGLGVMGHNTTGTLEGYGHDSEAGLSADLALRMLFGHNNYFRHGFTARGSYFAGRGFGREGYGFRFGLADLTYTVRTLLPCISRQDGARFYASGSLGVSGGWAGAGTGRGPMNTDFLVRTEAADALDHAVLGWVLGGTAEVHLGKVLIGISVDLRRLWGVDSPADNTWVRSGSLRFGYRFDGTDAVEARSEREQRDREQHERERSGVVLL